MTLQDHQISSGTFTQNLSPLELLEEQSRRMAHDLGHDESSVRPPNDKVGTTKRTSFRNPYPSDLVPNVYGNENEIESKYQSNGKTHGKRSISENRSSFTNSPEISTRSVSENSIINVNNDDHDISPRRSISRNPIPSTMPSSSPLKSLAAVRAGNGNITYEQSKSPSQSQVVPRLTHYDESEEWTPGSRGSITSLSSFGGGGILDSFRLSTLPTFSDRQSVIDEEIESDNSHGDLSRSNTVSTISTITGKVRPSEYAKTRPSSIQFSNSNFPYTKSSDQPTLQIVPPSERLARSSSITSSNNSGSLNADSYGSRNESSESSPDSIGSNFKHQLHQNVSLSPSHRQSPPQTKQLHSDTHSYSQLQHHPSNENKSSVASGSSPSPAPALAPSVYSTQASEQHHHPYQHPLTGSHHTREPSDASSYFSTSSRLSQSTIKPSNIFQQFSPPTSSSTPSNGGPNPRSNGYFFPEPTVRPSNNRNSSQNSKNGGLLLPPSLKKTPPPPNQSSRRPSGELAVGGSHNPTSTIPQYLLDKPFADMTLEDHVTIGIAYHEAGNLREASYHWQHAAFKGDHTAMLLYGLSLRHGWGMKQNPTEAVQWLRKAMESSIAEGMFKEGGYRKSIAPKEESNDSSGKVKKAHIGLALYELGMSYLHSWGIEKDETMALKSFELAGQLGDADALCEAAALYMHNGPKGRKKDLIKAAQLYREAGERGANMVGQSWVYKDKYMGESKKDKKKR